MSGNKSGDRYNFPMAQVLEGDGSIRIDVDNLYIDPVVPEEVEHLMFFIKRLKKCNIPYLLIQYYKIKQDAGPRLALFVENRKIWEANHAAEKPLGKDYWDANYGPHIKIGNRRL